MEPTDDVEQADVVVLNTCCIRENADNKLYGHLGHLKALKDNRPEMQIAVAGCLAQKDRDLIQGRAPHVDVVFGTHNVGNATALLRRAAIEGPVLEILEESDERIVVRMHPDSPAEAVDLHEVLTLRDGLVWLIEDYPERP